MEGGICSAVACEADMIASLKKVPAANARLAADDRKWKSRDARV
jgi:hypothetical protein